MDSPSRCFKEKHYSAVNRVRLVVAGNRSSNQANCFVKIARRSSAPIAKQQVRIIKRRGNRKMQPDRKSRLNYNNNNNNNNNSNRNSKSIDHEMFPPPPQLPAAYLSQVGPGEPSKKVSSATKTSAFAAKTKLCHSFLKSAPSLAGSIPVLILFLSLLILFDGAKQIQSQASMSHRQSMDELANLVVPFSPTRSPHPSTSGGNTGHRYQVRAPSHLEPKAEGSSNKLSRSSELDLFLDDMNHNELRDVVAGHPISDLFKPKPVAAGDERMVSQGGHLHHHHHHHNEEDDDGMNKQHEAAEMKSKHVESSSHNNNNNNHNMDKEGQVVRLDGSGSERQVYSECALILQRTYVKNIHDPKHQMIPFGKTEQACISYKHIDKAVEQAKHILKLRDLKKKRKKLAQSSRKPLIPFDVIHTSLEPPEDLVAAIGEINMATTQIIADQFDLSNDELLNGLPLIDMSKTKFWSICPLFVRQDIKCELGRFRTPTGHCNNLKHPSWGAAMTPFARYLPPVHPDGIWIPRKSVVTEITFDISDGHREMHSNIAPTMPMPVYDAHHQHVHHHHHHHHEAPASSHPGDSPGGEESAAAALADTPNEMSSAASVQFASHAKLDEMSDALMRSTERALAMPAGTGAGADMHPSPSGGGGGGGQLAAAASAPPHTGHKSAGHSVALDLPSARLVTSIVHRDVDLPNHDFSILFMSWGQLLDHDMTRAAQPPSSIRCCTQEEPKHKLCLPIQVPPNDPFYSKFNVQCLEFRRTLAGVRPNCVLGPRVHQNAITSPIDANFVYGSSQAQADSLRLFKGGQLRARDWFQREGLKPLLPAQDVEPDLECIGRPSNLFCFVAGDVRANEQTHLTVLHTLYMRQHNVYADKLASLNPHWNDERIYQETRHLMAAGVQHVMINEYLPLLIGKKMVELYNLTAHESTLSLQNHHNHHHHHHHYHHHDHDHYGGHHTYQVPSGKHAYWHGYDPTVTTSVSNSFAAAAFRQGHTFIQGTVERYNKFHEFVAAEKLRHLLKQPFLIYQPGVLDELTGGMINQPSQSYDPFLSEDISGHLFQAPKGQFGHDLAAINLQRGREQGLPGYNLFREWCGLPRAETFDQLEPYLTNHTAFHYSRLYKHVDDIDLWSGGVSERKLPGAAIGPTFACIIARQFSNTRRGDRFWYENPGLPSSFTPEQLGEIRKITLAKLLCSNSDDLPTIQRWALRMAHPVLNPRVPCDQLPEVDLQFWQEVEG